MEQRIIDLEEKFGFLERQVEQLDGVVTELYDVADAIRRDLKRVEACIEKVEMRIYEEIPDDEPHETG